MHDTTNSAADLAAHITAILSNDDTPVEIHNALFDGVLDAADTHHANLQHPDILPHVLRVVIEDKGEVRRKR